MPWIILTVKLATSVSPPRLSIHHATEWGIDNSRIRQDDEIEKGYIVKSGDSYIPASVSPRHSLPSLKEGDESGALGFWYKESRIKVYPHERNILDPQTMRDFIFGREDEGISTHELVPLSKADSLLLRTAEETALKDVMEAAILDGCNEIQALAMLMGMDIEIAESEFPPVGWFRAKREFAQIFCTENEMKED